MQFHASCAARTCFGTVQGILLRGPPGSGKSDLLLRLLHYAFQLVADDQVIVENGIAQAPASISGILEVRGLGLFRLPFLTTAPLRLVVNLGIVTERLPLPVLDPVFSLPMVTIDPASASAPERLILALDAATGCRENIAGAFTA